MCDWQNTCISITFDAIRYKIGPIIPLFHDVIMCSLMLEMPTKDDDNLDILKANVKCIYGCMKCFQEKGMITLVVMCRVQF